MKFFLVAKLQESTIDILAFRCESECKSNDVETSICPKLGFLSWMPLWAKLVAASVIAFVVSLVVLGCCLCLCKSGSSKNKHDIHPTQLQPIYWPKYSSHLR